MTINHAILGILSYRSLTGYDLKKIMQDSPFMYWSGNNNQIYKALVELYDDGYVTNETQHQDGSPSRKIYTITDDGLAALKRWSLITPEGPEIKNAFLIQLAWTWQLNNTELYKLLDQYEQEIKGRIFVERNKSSKKTLAPNRTPRENAVWKLIYENVVDVFEQELSWISRVRQSLGQFNVMEDTTQNDAMHSHDIGDKEMEYTVVKKDNKTYILLAPGGKELRTRQDGLDIIGICEEQKTNLLLIESERLPDDFFRLSTGVANEVLSRLVAFNIRTAAVIPSDRQKGRFRDFIAESNRGNAFHGYCDFADAENWLLKTH